MKFEEAHKAVKERKGKDEKIILYTKGYAAERAGCRAGIRGGKFGLRAPGAGAHMLVTRKGRVRGTVGGGAVEHECIQRALGVLDSRNSHLEEFRLHPNQAADLGMVCGGDISVFFRYMPSGDEQMIDLAIRAIRMFDQDRKCWLAMDLSKEGKGQMYLYEEGDLPKKVQVAVCAKTRSEPQGQSCEILFGKISARQQSLYFRRRPCGPGGGSYACKGQF